MRRSHPLESFLLGSSSLAMALLLAGLIEEGVKVHIRNGNAQLAADSLAMLWSPGVFALLAGVFLLRGFFQIALLTSRRFPRPRRSDRPGARLWRPHRPVRPAASLPGRRTVISRPAGACATDPYRLACQELGVNPGSSWNTIRATWRRGIPLWHPDAGGDPDLWHRRLAAYNLLEAWEGMRR